VEPWASLSLSRAPTFLKYDAIKSVLVPGKDGRGRQSLRRFSSGVITARSGDGRGGTQRPRSV
jgi:hypothetical protein